MTRWSSLALALLGAMSVADPSAATNLNDFARCLSRAGATYYTAAWCPHCRRQDAMFGSALRYLHAVDCTNGCSDVHSFPMWTFRDGSRHPGVASFDVLARKTRCSLNGERDEPRDDPRGVDRDDEGQSADFGTTERMIGGAKIIEVPRR